MNVREIGYKFVDWIQLDQNRVQRRALVNTAMNFEVSGEFLDYAEARKSLPMHRLPLQLPRALVLKEFLVPQLTNELTNLLTLWS
jgi:hypothetical protein